MTTRLLLVRLHCCEKILGDAVLQLGVYLCSKIIQCKAKDKSEEHIRNRAKVNGR